MEMKSVGLQAQQPQPIAFGRTEAIQTGSREILNFLSKDVSAGVRQDYKTNFLKKYNVQIQEQASNDKDLLGIVVSGFPKKVLDGLSSTYEKLPDSKLATMVINAKNKYVNHLYGKSQKDVTTIKTYKDLRHSFPVSK